MNAPVSAAERVRRSRWAGQVETAANKLHQLLLDAPIPMPREPVVDMDLVAALIELTGYEGIQPALNAEKSRTFRTREKNQRDWMRQIAFELDFNRDACIQRYADLDETGAAPRKSKTMSSHDYAAALWRDGVTKGWLSDGDVERQGNLESELSRFSKESDGFSGQDESDEVAKIERRLKLWVNRQHQVNAKILNAFLKLEQSLDQVLLADLAASIDRGIDFNSNFDQMRSIADKNHGKVFDLERDVVTIWPKVEHAVREYQVKVFGAGDGS